MREPAGSPTASGMASSWPALSLFVAIAAVKAR
ncbi:hypothetical protein RLDS_00335 [Sphingobium lactosutens DS20]|uniref:Uncharacterized protein n=1 Tax=Sphingobium lactosutens DS20 TaxID=1331060 RepID=T0I4N9_9SPHN|nr:hypothetical protein RLDS_00335 [Sphingobium lactosutens DS20]